MLLIHVIVAYNSPVDLQKLCHQIGLQNEEIHHLICIDNSSGKYQSSNKDILNQLGELFKINYFPSDENLGSAKGFSIGMQMAHEMHADWIWLHDQDGYPLQNCLEKLKRHFCDFQLIVPQVVDENNHYLSVFNGIYDHNDNIQFINLINNVTVTDVAATAGLMINRKLIDLIGVYDYKNYFIGMEDFDYCLRAKKNGRETFVIKDAHYFHPNKWLGAKRGIRHRDFYLGHFENNKVRGGSVYFRTVHSQKFVFISIVYSLIRLFPMWLFGKNVNIQQTLVIYLKAVKDRISKSKIIWNENIIFRNQI